MTDNSFSKNAGGNFGSTNRKHVQTLKWLRKLKGQNAKILREFLEAEPVELILDMDDDEIKIEYVLLNVENRIIYLEFDSRLRSMVHLMYFHPSIVDEIKFFIENCNFFCRCVLVFNGKLSLKISYGSGIYETIQNSHYSDFTPGATWNH